VNTFCQKPIPNLDKSNTVQIISYKPGKAKAGKNGSERIVIIQLIKGPKSGNNGKEGKAGPKLKALISELKMADTNLLRMVVTQISGKKSIDTFYVNPRYGQIKLIADGGDGGNGGQGETGGGVPGNGGKGGMGGQIEVVFDSSAVAFKDCTCLVFSNEGGLGGWSGENYGKASPSGSKGGPIYLKDQNSQILMVK
jgi:hypothetical protein